MSKRKQNLRNTAQGTDHRMVKNMDDLAEFEDFQQSILPKLRAGIKAGKSAIDLYKMVEAEAAARAITIGLTSEDEGRALTAVGDILNRVHGKATERKEIKHELAGIADDELDQLIISQMEDDSETDSSSH